MDKKRNILIAMMLVICLSSATLSIAFLRRSTTADNIITFGSVKMKLHETYIDTKGNEVPVDTSVTTDVTYDAIQNRRIKLENVGKHPIYVRLALTVSGKDEVGQSIETDQLVDVIARQSNWVYKNGWYYYQGILEPDMTTEPLITEVIFEINEITNRYPRSNYELIINAQGVQSENNATDILQVVGWPEE